MSCIPKNGNYSSILIKHKFGFSIKKRNSILKKENKFEISSFQIFYPNYSKPKINDIYSKDSEIQTITNLKKNQLMLLNVIKNQEKDLLKTFEEKLNIIYQYSTKLLNFINNTKEKHVISKIFCYHSILQFSEVCNDYYLDSFQQQNRINKNFLKIEKIFSNIIYNLSNFINKFNMIVQNQEEQINNKYKTQY